MRRTLLTALTVLALAATTSEAVAGPGQSGTTKIDDARVYAVDGDVSVDVVVRQPDAKADDPAPAARNRGRVAVALAVGEDEGIAAMAESTRLAISVPRSRYVVQTYRFVLDAEASRAALAAGVVEVAVAAQTSLDPDGPGPRDPSVSSADAADDVEVERLRDDPPRWQFFFTATTTSIACDLYTPKGDDCRVSWDDGRATPPFDGGGSGMVRMWRDVVGRQVVELDVTRSPGSENFRGATLVGFGSNVLEGGTDAIASWGARWAQSGSREGASPGQPGGPLYLDISGRYAHDWGVWGYLRCSPVATCSIPQR